MSTRLGLTVDAISAQPTGVGRYALELARRLPADPAIESVHYFLGRREVADLAVLSERKMVRRSWLSRLKSRLNYPRLDLVHGPNYFLPDWAESGVITVHDLSVFRFPETHPGERVADFERKFESSFARARVVITDCETIRQELIETTGCAPDRVVAIPLGISPAFSVIAAEEREATLRKLGVPLTGYGLTVSSLEPRKRIDRLINAWRHLPKQLRNRFQLVIAGAEGWRNEVLHQHIDDGVREGWLKHLSFVSEADLPALYSGAQLFVYPSKYEGFGLPPLEAMASGVPAIVAEGTCLEEVTGGAARLGDPEDQQNFTILLEESLEDERWRQAAISAGIQVAGTYTWERCLEKTVASYRTAIGNRSKISDEL